MYAKLIETNQDALLQFKLEAGAAQERRDAAVAAISKYTAEKEEAERETLTLKERIDALELLLASLPGLPAPEKTRKPANTTQLVKTLDAPGDPVAKPPVVEKAGTTIKAAALNVLRNSPGRTWTAAEVANVVAKQDKRWSNKRLPKNILTAFAKEASSDTPSIRRIESRSGRSRVTWGWLGHKEMA